MKACLDVLRKKNVSSIYFLGDLVGYLPLVEDVLKVIRDEGIIPIMGNHDAMICGQLDIEPDKSDIYGFDQLAEDIVTSVCSEVAIWQRRIELNINGRKLLLVHGSPWDELNEYIYKDNNLSRFEALDYDVVFMGHTHYPFSERFDDMLLVNVGSCGLPRDIGNLASCVIYDPETNSAEIIRAEYDVDKLVKESTRIGSVSVEVKNCLKRGKV